MHQDRAVHRSETVADRVHLIYWILKEEIANRKVESLQALVDRIGNNPRLCDFRHTSSTSVSEFIFFISNYLRDEILADVRKSACWSSMVDESTDIACLQQYITFVRYVTSKGTPATKFLDIRAVDARGATASNLFRLWKEVASDCKLDKSKHVAMACDGAAAMLGRNNSLSQKIKEENPSTYIVHCYAHRLALACTDSKKNLKSI